MNKRIYEYSTKIDNKNKSKLIEAEYHHIKRIKKQYGFTIDINKTKKQNAKTILSNMTKNQYNNKTIKMSYHNLCTKQNHLPP